MSSEKNGLCRQAFDRDVKEVAIVHLDAFKGFFLTELGYKFLCVMYRAFLLNPSSIFVVHEANSGRVTGFAVGTLGGRKKDCWLAVRFLPQFLLAALPAIARSPRAILRRLAARFFETGSTFRLPNNAVMLRSIGVVTSEHGSTTAFSVLEAFEKVAFTQGATHIFLTTDQDNNDRAQNFYKRHGYCVVERFQQDGYRPMYLMSKYLNGAFYE